ncbi:phage major capsid protein, HK97 family [Desulfarculus baarsii DSM 2075]|uniref:Phage major capsid protein, HK97 family n=2 Tax=Desulfarculus baarsii TaxID=453230 RepID=E1QJ59_DESB2|nr:phage major capsid protein, HK97 family [Desulfarculus baarsii DSM 2075]
MATTESRTMSLELGRKADEEARCIGASLSSEAPVARRGGDEILEHTPEAVDLSRAPLPLLEGHDASRVNIGVVEDLRLAGGKLRGVLRFGATGRAKELWEDVKAGIVRGISIGYEVLETRNQPGGYRVVRWRPLEVSLVAVPADGTVGIGRGYNYLEGMKKMDKNDMLQRQAQLADEIETLAARDSLTPDEGVVFARLREEADTLTRRMEMLDAAAKLRPAADKPRPRIVVEDRAAASESHGFRGLGEFVRAVMGGRDERLQTRAMNSVSGVDGGFLIPQAYGAPILDMALEQSILASRCKVYRTNAASLTVPAISDSDHSADRGGLVATWTAEGAEMTPDDIQVRAMTFNPHKLTLLLKATREFMEDAPNAEAFIRETLAAEIRWAIDHNCILAGNGVGKPLAIFNSDALATVAKESAQSNDTFLWENAVNMAAKLAPAAEGKAVWLMSPSLKGQVYTMAQTVGTGGSNVWSDVSTGGKGQNLLGHPIIWSEHTSVLGDKGDVMLVNPSAYALCIRSELRLEASRDIYFTSDHVAFRATVRLDGMPIKNGLLTLADGVTEVADFVTLAAR